MEADPDSNEVPTLFISDRHTVGVLDSKFRLYCLVEVSFTVRLFVWENGLL